MLQFFDTTHILCDLFVEKTYVAMYPFTPSDPNHLALARNDVLLHLDDAPNGWKKGRNKNSGKEGWFPESYVREGVSIVTFLT